MILITNLPNVEANGNHLTLSSPTAEQLTRVRVLHGEDVRGNLSESN